MFARPTTSGWGKSTEPLKTLVPPEVKEAFERRARELGYQSASDALREQVILFAFGADFLRNLHLERIGMLSRNMAEIGPVMGAER